MPCAGIVAPDQVLVYAVRGVLAQDARGPEPALRAMQRAVEDIEVWEHGTKRSATPYGAVSHERVCGADATGVTR